MALLAVVLVAVLLVFNITSYNSQYNSIMSALDYALNAGPEGLSVPRIGGPFEEDGIDSAAAQDLGIQDMSIPVYCVSIANDGTVKAASNNAYMSTTLVANAVNAIAYTGKSRGELSDMGLFFSVGNMRNELRIAFADSESLHSDTTGRVVLSLAVGAVTLGVLFLVSLWLSRLALKPVRRAWDGQQRFIADASHELKTPLTVILANNDILMAHPDSTVDEQRRWVQSTTEEATRMQDLVKDLLVLAQTEPDNIQTFRANLQLETVDFSAVVEMDILQFEAVAFDRGVEMEDQIEEGLMVKADADKLERVVRVLLDNACKYASSSSAGSADNDETGKLLGVGGLGSAGRFEGTEGIEDAAGNFADAADAADADRALTLRDVAQGAAEIHDAEIHESAEGLHMGAEGLIPSATFSTRTNYVKVTLNKEKSQGVLRVNNGGDPIDPADLPHVFEKFFRSDKARTGKTEGHGLGLSIAKNIVEGFGGTIIAESNMFEGTTFTVRLPLV